MKKFSIFILSLVTLSYGVALANVAPDPITNGASLSVNQTNVQSTPGTPQTTAVTVQGNASGVPIPVSGSVTATNPSVSTTGSAPPASATYVGGSVTTAAPSYTTGQMSAFSLNVSGGLRVDGSGVTQPISAAALPLPAGAATATGVAAVVTALGTPMQQTGGSVTSLPVSVSSGAITRVSNATSSTSILASNGSRKGAIFYNDDTASVCKIAFAATASATSFTIVLTAGSHYEMPNTPLYTGAVSAICSLATGAIQATEF